VQLPLRLSSLYKSLLCCVDVLSPVQASATVGIICFAQVFADILTISIFYKCLLLCRYSGSCTSVRYRADVPTSAQASVTVLTFSPVYKCQLLRYSSCCIPVFYCFDILSPVVLAATVLVLCFFIRVSDITIMFCLL
jgi:hypothetical protein